MEYTIVLTNYHICTSSSQFTSTKALHPTSCFIHPHNTPVRVIFFPLTAEKLKFREVSLLIQGHTASKWQSQDTNHSYLVSCLILPNPQGKFHFSGSLITAPLKGSAWPFSPHLCPAPHTPFQVFPASQTGGPGECIQTA